MLLPPDDLVKAKYELLANSKLDAVKLSALVANGEARIIQST